MQMEVERNDLKNSKESIKRFRIIRRGLSKN